MTKTLKTSIQRTKTTSHIIYIPDMNTKIITMAMAVCSLQTLPTQAQTTLSLEQCRNLAVDHNVKMQNARNDISAAEEQQREAFTKYFPTVSASGSAFNANKDMLSLQLQPGMEMSLLKNGITAGITAMQPVFAGGQIVNGNKLARVGTQVSRLQLQQDQNEVELTAERYYWQIVMLREKMHTVDVVDSMLARLCTDVEMAVKAGVALRNDLLQVQLKRNETEATRANLDNAIALSRMLLAQYIGLDSADVQPASHIDMASVPPSPASLLVEHRQALLNTPEYALLQKNVDAARLQKKIAVGENMPSVAVGAGYLYNNLMDKDQKFGIVMATVSVPLSAWWGGSHAIKRRKLQEQNARNTLEDNSQLLVIRMQNAWNSLDNAYKQLTIAARSIEQSAENLRIDNDCYHAGTITMSDLLEAQMLYQQSRDKFVENYANYQTKRTEYLQATGR